MTVPLSSVDGPLPARTPITQFDPLGELPRGTVILEASAGTGKTWTIAALAARYVADGLGLDQLMMITFTRQATQELRNRIRDRLLRSARHLRDVLTTGGRTCDDPIDALLASGPRAQVELRLQRLTRALTDFDAATISTTHEFCQRMLAGLGVLVDHSADDTLVEDLSDRAREVAADFYLRAYADASPEFDYRTAIQLAEEVVAHPDAVIRPDDDSARSRFAKAVRNEVEKRKRQLGLYTFHDQQQRLADALANPAAQQRLSDQFPVVLVDEFQDTDQVQWQILRTAFHRRSTLILIGDPKQAIYGFRGADVHSYLRAVGETEQVATLGINRRSDARLVTALGELLGGAELGDRRIRVHPVEAAHTRSRLEVSHPLLLRVRPDDGDHWATTLQSDIDADLVHQVRQLLAEAPKLTEERDGEQVVRPLRAGDLAVLTQTNWLADSITDSLASAGVPVVRVGAGSVYLGEEAKDWLALLRALAKPRPQPIRRATLTSFIGWTLPELAAADESALAQVSQRIRRWKRLVDNHGIAALSEAVAADGVAERLLRTAGGSRRWTDLRHIGQELHAVQRARQLGLAGLIEWLAEQMDTSSKTVDERARRLDTDEDAVQVMTLHSAKGLEFPVVLLPDLWRAPGNRSAGPQTRNAADGQRILDISGSADADADRASREDSLRRTYVALTRASRLAIAWWAWNDKVSPQAPLHRLLQRPAQVAVPPVAAARGVDPHTAAGFTTSTIDPQPQVIPPDPAVPGGSRLRARRFDREIDQAWRRTSYSGLTAAAHDAPHPGAVIPPPSVTVAGSEPLGPLSDEPETGSDPDLLVLDSPPSEAPGSSAPGSDASEIDSPGLDTAGLDSLRPDPAAGGTAPEDPRTGVGTPDLGLVSPMSGMVAGTSFGTLVHEILERVDTRAEDLAAEVRAEVNTRLRRLPLDGVDPDHLAQALVTVLRTPLGPMTGGRSLADFAPADRLPELDFEYPLGGGDRPTTSAVIADIAALLRDHLPDTDPLVDYPGHLANPLLAEEPLRGWLTGSIDAVLRAPVNGPDQRHFVVDYKTNWLGGPVGEVLTIGSYVPKAMAQAMMAAHYPLQALLYCVALHRFLRWRLPDYRPDDHLGGVLYLFVRGMAGPQTPVIDGTPCGVFAWQPPTQLIIDLSDLLHGGESGWIGQVGP